jgi:hypothetical protein
LRILIDEQLPRQLAPYLVGHDARTVQQEFQQNISKSRLGVVVLRAASNALEDLLPLVPAALTAIATVRPGQLVRVEA